MERLAAIDIGSNSIRLVVAELLPSGDYRVLDEERQTTRLARSLAASGALDAEAMEQTLAALRRFRKIAEGFETGHLRTIATCAVREADNGPQFCRRVEEESGLAVEVISADDEAQYAFRSVRQAFDISDKNVAIADIGGGSTEIILASGHHIEAIYPTRLGAVRMTEMYGSSRRLFDEDIERMRRHIDKELKRALKKRPFEPHMLFGSGGTFTSIASMLLAAKGQPAQSVRGHRVTHAEIRHLADHLQKLSVKQRRAVPGLSADRADIIVAGIAVVDGLMHRLKVNKLQIHDRGVRDGLLLCMIAATQPEVTAQLDSRAALAGFAISCGVDWPQARHVAELSAQLFDQLVEPLALDPADRPLLAAAAMLQDVGYLISYDAHHRHSYQLIRNSQLPGFSRHELELIANVARYHRGATPKQKHGNFRNLDETDQQRVYRLAAIVRLAGGLDRSHTQNVRRVRATVTAGRIRLDVTAGADPEVDIWAARSRSEMLSKCFGREVVIQAVQ